MADALDVRSPAGSGEADVGPDRGRTPTGIRLSLDAPGAELGPRIVDLLPLAVLCLDRDGLAVLVNAAWTVLVGRPVEAELGAGWLDVFPRADRAEITEWICAAAHEPRAVARDIHVGTAIGERLLRFAGQPSVDRVGCSTMYVLSATDVTEQVALEERLTFDASHDSLTGLTNRGGFVQSATRLTSDAMRIGRTDALLLIDLDGFKIINDVGGHRVGDQVLKVVAERIRAVVRPVDVVARIGGDEFAVVTCGIDTVSEAHALGTRILRRLAAPMVIDGVTLHVGASIGVSVTTDDRVSELLERADRSLYAAKAQGKGRIVLHGDLPVPVLPRRPPAVADRPVPIPRANVSAPSAPPPFHAVHVYENDADWLPAVVGYVGAGLLDDGAVTVVATAAHRQQLDARLGADLLARARASGRYVELDAAETLRRVVRNGYPDTEQFHMVVGTPVLRSVTRHLRFRAYGEMVGLLWAQGNAAGALRLEDMWNELQQRVSFPLMCAYANVDQPGDGRHEVMRRHSTSTQGGS